MGGGPFRAPLPPSNAPRRRNSMLPPVPAMTPRVTQGAGAAAAARPGFAASEVANATSAEFSDYRATTQPPHRHCTSPMTRLLRYTTTSLRPLVAPLY